MKYTQILLFMKSTVLLTVLMLAFAVPLTSQDWSRMDVDFRGDGKLLLNSGINGMVAPQFSNYDFNGDGNEDLFVFDRQSGVVMAFVWDTSGEEGRMVFAPEYAAKFPEMTSFCRLIDYDRDGDRDIFTFPITAIASSIQVFRNHGSDANPDFRVIKFPNAVADVLNFPFNGTNFAVFVAQSDIPGIADVDGDGDIDILSFEQGSGSQLGFFRNMQVEQGLPLDSILLVEEDKCWGKFLESGLASDIFLSDNPHVCASGLVGDGKGSSGLRHSGSTLELFDQNGDGLTDAVIGDLSSGALVGLTNGGSLESAWMTEQDVRFPGFESAAIEVFLSSFYVDTDADGVRELVVTVNEINSSWNVGHVWLYENNGTDAAPVFELQTKEFLYDASLRIPEASKPHFVDIDQDGLLDLLVGSEGERSPNQQFTNRLFYFRNSGTASAPKYILEDDDFLNFSEVQDVSKLHPITGDLDSDGDLDLLIGIDEGELIYFENTSTAGQPLSFEAPVFDFMNIDVGKDAKPIIMDMDEDGLLDLVIGAEGDKTDFDAGRKGGVSFYKNVGTANSPLFLEDADVVALGGVFTKDIRVASGASSPVFIPTAMMDDYIVIAGTNYGPLAMYDQVLGNINDTFNLVTDSLPVIRYGRRTGLDFADIDNDNYYEIVVGNQNGGLAFHNTPFQVSIENATDDPLNKAVQVFPNPTRGNLTIVTKGPLPDSYQLMGLGGNIISTSRVVTDQIHLPELAAGFYLLKLNFGLQSVVKKVVVQE